MRFALTTGERGLTHHHKFHPQDAGYNLSGLLRLTGPVDGNRLARCIERVVNAVDAFRSIFVDDGGETFRETDPSRITQVEIIARGAAESETAFLAEVQAEAARLQNATPSPSTWPLFTCRLYVAGPDCVYMLHSAPHLLADGYSVAMCYAAVSALYNSPRPEDVDLAALVSDAGAARARTPRDERTDTYFRQALEGVDSFELPGLAQPRDDRGGITGRVLAFGIPRERIDPELARLKAPAAQAFLTAYAGMLKRLVPAAETLVVGYAVPNRPPEHRRSIGCFVNTAPLVLQLDEATSLAALGQDITSKLFRLYRYQDFDATKVANILPRFSCLFTTYPEELGLDLAECACAALPIARQHLPGEIRLTVETRRSEYWFVFDLGAYFSEIDVEEAYRRLLAAVLGEEAATVGSATLTPARLGSAAAAAAIAAQIGTHSGGAPEAFERVVRRQADLPAVTFGREHWTYRRLNAVANQMARVLVERAPTASAVVVAADRSQYTVALILAVLKSGKTYVPLDPRLPEERRRQVLEDLGQSFIVGSSELRGEAWGLALEDVVSACEGRADDDLATTIEPDRDAYMIYTSGSTGAPKGVALTHRNLLSLMLSAAPEFDFSNRDVWTLFHSFSFDYSIWEIFGCLLHGGRLVVVDFATTQDIANYAALLRREGVSVINHTPTVFMHLVREDALARAPIRPRIVFLGGEALNFAALKTWMAKRTIDQCRLVNLYGPTEGTVLVTFHELSTADLDGGRSIVGRPLASAGVEIVSPGGSVAPQGVPGEIVMTGLGVAPRGYFKRPAETARRFFARAGGAGFKTGDLGRVAADGRIDFLGRLDRQIKVRGFRVEPGDIEAALLRSPWVRACAVGTRCQPGTELVLVAYIAPFDERCTPEALREHARGQLPAYMVPSSFVLVERIPTTLSGKIDFDALAAAAPQTRAVKGRSALEQWLFGLVAHKLGSDDFEVTDNLLDVGVTSLDAVDLVGSVRERLGPETLSVTDLFEHSTVQALALHLEGPPTAPRAEGEGRARAVARQAGLARRFPTRSLDPRGVES